MFSDKKNIYILSGIIFAAIAFYVGLTHLNIVLGTLGVVMGWFAPVVMGLAVAFFLNVFVRFIEERLLKKFAGKKWVRAVSIPFSIIFILLVLTLLSIFIVPEIKKTVFMLADVIPAYVNELIEKADKIKLPVDNMSLGDIFSLDKFDDITGFITKQSVNMVGNALNITTTFAGKLFDGLLSFIIAIYVLAYKEKLGKLATRTVKAFLPQEQAQTVLDVAQLSYTTFYNFITGQLTEAVILGTLCYLGMLIFRFPYAAAVGMLVGITALIPIVGAFIGIIIGAFLIVIVDPLKALLFVVFILILQQIEGNLIYPKVVGKSVGLPDILVISAVLVGGRIGGIAAVLLSVPLCSILYSVFKTQLERKEKKHIDNRGKM